MFVQVKIMKDGNEKKIRCKESEERNINLDVKKNLLVHLLLFDGILFQNQYVYTL